jgi:preprotein translocase subunit SecG
MYQVIIVIHVLLGLSIVGLILMQQGKGADAGATFGGGASGSVFGAQGAASFLSRTTAILATMFFITSLGLAWLNGNKSGAAVDFMTTPAVEKETADTGLPNIDGTESKQSVPAPSTESNAGASTPVAVEPQLPSPAAVEAPKPGLEKIDVPKAADVKVIEGQAIDQKPEIKSELPKKKASANKK